MFWNPAAIRRQLRTIIEQQETIMTNQEQLDARVAVLAKNVADAIDAIKNQPGAEALDFSALDAASAALDAATPNAEPPAEPPVA